MGDRVTLISDGVLQQVGSPDTVYENPANVFVAGFIGSPAMSFNRFSVTHSDGTMRLVRCDLRLQVSSSEPVPQEVIAGVRPEHTQLWEQDADLIGPIQGRVQFAESIGRETFAGVVSSDDTHFTIQMEGRHHIELDEMLCFGLQPGWLYLFDPSTERMIGRI